MMVLQFGGRTLQKLTTLVGIARQGAFWWHEVLPLVAPLVRVFVPLKGL